MLRLREQVCTHFSDWSVRSGKHEQVTRTGELVDANFAASEQSLGFLDVSVAGPSNHIHTVDCFSAEGQRRDRVRAAEPPHLVDTA